MQLLILLIFGVLSTIPVSGRLPKRMVRERDFDGVRMDQKTYEKAHMIHYNWYVHSVKAIMGSLGKQLMKQLHKDDKLTFYWCLDKIPDRRDVVAAAKCLTAAKNTHEERKRLIKSSSSEKNKVFVMKKKTKSSVENASKNFQKTKRIRNDELLPAEIAPKLRIRSGKSSEISQKFIEKTKIVDNFLDKISLAKAPAEPAIVQEKLEPLRNLLRKSAKVLKGKKHKGSFLYGEYKKYKVATRLRRAKRSLQRLVGDGISKSDSMRYTIKVMDRMPALKKVEKSGVRKVTNLIREMIGVGNMTGWSESYKNLLVLKKAMDKRAKDPGAKVYDYRMLDLVMDRSAPTNSLHDKTPLPPMIREAFNLLEAFEKSPKSVSDSANIKFLSPRFAPLMPDKMEMRGKLSPSILSFYNDETEEQILPIPKLLESTGMNDDDRQNVLETIMELSGARETVDDAIELLQHTKLFGMEGELKEVTQRLAGYFQDLENSFNRKQQKDMKKHGFTFMETNQIEEMYDKQGLKGRDDVGFNVAEYKNLTRKQREESLWLRIAKIALNGTEEPEHTREKRATLFSFLAPTVLAPYMFTPIYGLVVLGPTVLSPSLFSPLILNPAVLSPYVFSPAVGMPFILSPYILSPYVISPLVFAPFILNPYVVAPNVINPYVLSPLILSPLVVCPDVLSPMVGGGGILSPAVASPSVLSKSVLMASVLSPSVLS